MTDSYVWTTPKRTTNYGGTTTTNTRISSNRDPITPEEMGSHEFASHIAHMNDLLTLVENSDIKYERYIKNLIIETGGLTDSEKALAKLNQKIACIKEIRTRVNIGLKEAKDLVEYYINNSSLLEPRKTFKNEIDKILKF